MADPPSELKQLLLQRLHTATGHKLPASQFKPYSADLRRLSADAAVVQAAQNELVQAGLVEQKNVGGGRSYRLTAAGEAALREFAPRPPEHLNQKLLPYQRTFLLFRFLRTWPDGKLTRNAVDKDLSSAEALVDLGFAPPNAEPAGRRPDGRLLDWLLHALVQNRALERSEARGVVSYRLTEDGMRQLWAGKHYPALGIRFPILKGKVWNSIIPLICEANGFERSNPPEPGEVRVPDSAREAHHTKPESDAHPVTAETLLREVGALLRSGPGRDGMVPIHELRKVLAGKYGSAAPDAETFNRLLLDLDRQNRVRLVAIGDRSRATEQQLNDSIPGVNETFFYVEVAHEHAGVG